MNEELPPPSTISRLSEAVYPSFAMLAGMQLDLFTPLSEGELTAEALAERLEVDPVRLQPLLYALVMAGFLRAENGRFANTPEADAYLVRGRPGTLIDRHLLLGQIWSAALQTAATIRSGVAQALHDVEHMTSDELMMSLRGLHPRAIAGGHEFAAEAGWAGPLRVADVGGGSGGFSIGLADALPELTAVVVELPQVVPVTEGFLAEAGPPERVSVVAGDVVREPLSGEYDIALLQNFIQILSPEQAQAALRHVYAGLRPGGRLCILGHILDDSRLSPEDSVAANLVFLNIYAHGQAYTRREHEDWIAAAGFEDIVFESEEQVTARRPG